VAFFTGKVEQGGDFLAELGAAIGSTNQNGRSIRTAYEIHALVRLALRVGIRGGRNVFDADSLESLDRERTGRSRRKPPKQFALVDHDALVGDRADRTAADFQ
jgi:hypothetical protein